MYVCVSWCVSLCVFVDVRWFCKAYPTFWSVYTRFKYIYTWVCARACLYCVCVCVCVCACVRAIQRLPLSVCVYAWVCVCMSVCVCVCMCVYACVCMCVICNWVCVFALTCDDYQSYGLSSTCCNSFAKEISSTCCISFAKEMRLHKSAQGWRNRTLVVHERSDSLLFSIAR